MSDKKIAARLIDALEAMYVENVMLQSMIMTYRQHYPEIGDWEKDLAVLRQQKQQDVRAKFVELRHRIETAYDAEQTLDQLLKALPHSGSVQ